MGGISSVTRTKKDAQNAYDRMSHFYDLVAGTSERKFTNRALKLLAARPGEHILEIGCGTGHSLASLAQNVGKTGKVTGIDISPGMISVARHRLKSHELAGQVVLNRGDAVNLPYSNDHFDAIFLSFTLELFDSPEIPLVLNECWRVLKPDGRIGVVALYWQATLPVRIYEWAHARFPKYIDCRPIHPDLLLQAAGYRLMDIENKMMWGLPVMILCARKPRD